MVGGWPRIQPASISIPTPSRIPETLIMATNALPLFHTAGLRIQTDSKAQLACRSGNTNPKEHHKKHRDEIGDASLIADRGQGLPASLPMGKKESKREHGSSRLLKVVSVTRQTGHRSSRHAMSQNIHSYRELIRKASIIRAFSAVPASLASLSTRARIHWVTSANAGDP